MTRDGSRDFICIISMCSPFKDYKAVDLKKEKIINLYSKRKHCKFEQTSCFPYTNISIIYNINFTCDFPN